LTPGAKSFSDAERRQIDSIPWFHSIDLGGGVVTVGASEFQIPEDRFPPFAGRSVLDIGTWDGYYSFMAERLGARHVVALDHYAWGVDIDARGEYWTECAAAGTLPDLSRDLTEFWRPDLPGRRGFDFASAALGSAVEARVADFTTVDLAELGTFDVVLYLGVLYHMKEPLTCLERLRAVTGCVAVIETLAVHLQHLEHASLLQFHDSRDLNYDFGNWYVPTLAGLESLCRAAGFASVRTIAGPPDPDPPARESLLNRAGRRLTRSQRVAVPVSAPSTFYRAIVHASA
jgi:tRNA (mo5U34)-methyltransferase